MPENHQNNIEPDIFKIKNPIQTLDKINYQLNLETETIRKNNGDLQNTIENVRQLKFFQTMLTCDLLYSSTIRFIYKTWNAKQSEDNKTTNNEIKEYHESIFNELIHRIDQNLSIKIKKLFRDMIVENLNIETYQDVFKINLNENIQGLINIINYESDSRISMILQMYDLGEILKNPERYFKKKSDTEFIKMYIEIPIESKGMSGYHASEIMFGWSLLAGLFRISKYVKQALINEYLNQKLWNNKNSKFIIESLHHNLIINDEQVLQYLNAINYDTHNLKLIKKAPLYENRLYQKTFFHKSKIVDQKSLDSLFKKISL